MEQLAFLSGECEHRDERQQNDGHGEEHRPADESCGLQDGLPHQATVAGIDRALLQEAEGVLGDDDAGIHQDTDRDRNTRQAHDVGGDAGVVHAEKRDEHRQRQRNRHDEDGPEVHQEDHMRERHEDDLFDERPPQRAGRLLDERGPVVERHDRDALG